MTENDRHLVAQAKSIHCSDWTEIDLLIKQADSQETVEYLEWIQRRLYHLDEYNTDNRM